jgi:hypothetical protein
VTDARRVLAALFPELAAVRMEPIDFDRESCRPEILRLRWVAAPWTGDMLARAHRLRGETGCSIADAYLALR